MITAHQNVPTGQHDCWGCSLGFKPTIALTSDTPGALLPKIGHTIYLCDHCWSDLNSLCHRTPTSFYLKDILEDAREEGYSNGYEEGRVESTQHAKDSL